MKKKLIHPYWIPRVEITSIDDVKVICQSPRGMDIEIEDPKYGEGDPSLG